MKDNNLGARPPVPLSDGLDTRPCKILDPALQGSTVDRKDHEDCRL